MTGFVQIVIWTIVAVFLLLIALGLVLLAHLLIFDRISAARDRRAAAGLEHTEPFDEFFDRLERSFRNEETR